MKLRTPEHIKKAAFKLKEISTQKRLEYEVKSAEEILKDLEKELTFLEVVEIIKDISDLAFVLGCKPSDVFKQSNIEIGLEEFLTEAKAIRPEIENEVNNLLSFMISASKFKTSWGHDDANDIIREFKIINTQEEWNELLDKNKKRVHAEELTIDFYGQKIYNYIKVVHISNGFWDKDIQEQKEKIIQEVGLENFWNGYYRFFEIWFNQLRRGTYYIFIPEII